MSKEKITELTKEQKTRFAEFVDKWTRIGLSTEPADRQTAEQGIKKIYSMAGLEEPKIVWCSSPLVNGLVRAFLLGQSVGQSVRQSVGQSVWQSVGQSVWQSVGQSVGESVRESVGESVGESVRESVWQSGYGQHDANWLGFYDYFCLVCRLEKETEKLQGMWDIAKSANWYLPHEKICWISERHNILKLDKRGRLHCESGMALAYPDGWGIYALNGVRMKPEYVLTPANKLSPEVILKEQNVDVRRELIRKVGVLKLIGHGKEINQVGEYKLIDMSPIFEGIRYAPYLLMKNPSVDDTWHLEGVHPDCKTVEEAINWRAGNINIRWTPAMLS